MGASLLTASCTNNAKADGIEELNLNHVKADEIEQLTLTMPDKGVTKTVRVAVLRHGERLDHAQPSFWYASIDGRNYPFDCPLTELGRRQAANAAQELARLCPESFSLVVSSPFLRCVSTAAEVCRVLGLPLCVDAGLGEIYGPQYFGPWEEPGPPLRSPAEVAALIPKGVQLIAPLDGKNGWIGKAPIWPEDMVGGRVRMANRVEQYVSKALKLGGPGFLLVSHGDCVFACLTLALAGGITTPSTQLVKSVKYCGWALLEHDYQHEDQRVELTDPLAGWRVRHGNCESKDYCLTDQPLPEDDQALAEACDLEEKRAEFYQLKAGRAMHCRSVSTDIFHTFLDEQRKLQAEPPPADVTFSELLPRYPHERCVSTDESLQPFASDIAC